MLLKKKELILIKYIKTTVEKYNISWRFVKFLFVGAINTLFGYIVFAIFNFIGLHYSLSVFLSTVLGVLFNFKTTGCIVFKNGNNKLFIKFVLVYALTYLFAVSMLTVFSKIGLENMYINYALIIPVNALLSYFLMKKFVF